MLSALRFARGCSRLRQGVTPSSFRSIIPSRAFQHSASLLQARLINPPSALSSAQLNLIRSFTTRSRTRDSGSNPVPPSKRGEDKEHGRQGQGGSQEEQREQGAANLEEKNRNIGLYILALAILVLGGAYAAVPLYRLFCRVTGFGGTTQEKKHGVASLAKRNDDDPGSGNRRMLTFNFNADTGYHMPWTFFPTQGSVQAEVGETVLAFYTAKNLTDKPMIGVATYNVTPSEAGQYFNKIQCFCFDEQRLEPHEEVEMPVFFFVDPEFDKDPKMGRVHEITLSYTFFPSDSEDEPDEAENAPADAAAPAKA